MQTYIDVYHFDQHAGHGRGSRGLALFPTLEGITKKVRAFTSEPRPKLTFLIPAALDNYGNHRGTSLIKNSPPPPKDHRRALDIFLR